VFNIFPNGFFGYGRIFNMKIVRWLSVPETGFTKADSPKISGNIRAKFYIIRTRN